MGFWTLFKIQKTQIFHKISSLKEESKLKLFVIVGFALLLWAGLFGVFWESFTFLKQFQEIEVPLVENIFSLFFFSLFVMLSFSNGIIIYSSLFRSEEAKDLMIRPISPDYIYLSCFGSAILFSSWAFMFLGAPLILAYGVSHSIPLLFYPMAFMFFVAFLLLPSAIGGFLSLWLTYYFPRNLKSILFLFLFLLICFGGFKYFDIQTTQHSTTAFTKEWMGEIFQKFSFARNPLYPSYWASEGVLASASQDYKRSFSFLLLLFSNGLFFTMISMMSANKLLRPAYNLVFSHGNKKQRRRFSLLEKIFHKIFFFIPFPLRYMIIKDIKTFFRDPVQWSQVLIFLGLLSLYILNIRQGNLDINQPFWKVTITYLNMFAVSLTLCTFTSRFIFPQNSLEGKRFWILGVLPITRKDLLAGKFLFSFGGILLLSETIMILSFWRVQVPLEMAILNVILMVFICSGLTGLSVGLGAIYPNFQEENPSKIVAGFGGTLNLILSLFFVLTLILIQLGPIYFYYVHKSISPSMFHWLTIGGLVGSLLITLLFTFIPLKIGNQCFSHMEI